MSSDHFSEQVGEQSGFRNHRESVRRKIGFLVGTTVLLGILWVVGVAVGSVSYPLGDVVAALVRDGPESRQLAIWHVRIPRVLAATLAGGGLAVAGAAMQSVLRNPLGAPFTLGISHAAAFGAAVTIAFGGFGVSAEFLTLSVQTIGAFVGAMTATVAILLLVTYREATPETLILTGVAIGSLFNAGLALIQYFATDTEVAEIVYWTFGDVSRAAWDEIGFMFAIFVLGLGYFVYNGWNYDVLDAGTETALTLGVNVESLRIRGMAIASLVTAVMISFVGIIGFVGLVAPHIVRMVIGGTERYLLPASALVGAALLVAADTFARTIVAPIVLPVGIVTSFLGAPLFLYLTVEGKDYWR
ncbi:ABC-type Fe3+-siderophore transport system, permease component [Halalkaliarchaeum sp. AArc-CO]|uniref:FecCD family ABC transporter permease n=1 Tax=unclassified Halalkaliarchaeum TaxID=2678344 RepID=UPI00217DF6CD|nr:MULTISPECIES: iron ABC transporter permease [unclassified Halalkaliarchaeum]MDR5674494.1 iron ABC transporter permease [Halalkaliarchaeum sp. AArc-GB]UWG50396.1 ABC-type Fe3+-siderophore transport system, permease component [Halalkaliarchaeum sp. AArc-CO]